LYKSFVCVLHYVRQGYFSQSDNDVEIVNTLKRISNWPLSFCYILGKALGEKYK